MTSVRNLRSTVDALREPWGQVTPGTQPLGDRGSPKLERSSNEGGPSGAMNMPRDHDSPVRGRSSSLAVSRLLPDVGPCQAPEQVLGIESSAS